MKKKLLIKLLKNAIEQNKKKLQHGISSNSLDDTARGLLEETIRGLEDLLREADGEPDDVDVDNIVERMSAIMDEKISAALEKVNPTPAGGDLDRAENYLRSSNAVRDYAQCLRNNPKNLNAFRAAWRKKLSENGITIIAGSEDAFLPGIMRSSIDDNWHSDTNWLRRLNHTGAKRFALRFTEQDQDNLAVRAKGHRSGEAKADQEVELAAKTISVQAIYKKLSVDKITEYEDDGALLQWVADEITRQMFYEIGRAILVGDGRSASDPDAIGSFESINRAATDAFVNVATYGQHADIVEEVMEELIAPIYDGREIVLFVNKADLFELRKYVTGTGATTRYASIDELKGMLGVADIVVLPYMDGTTSGAARMIAMHLDSYYTVGKMDGFEFVTWEDYDMNVERFRGETFAGGAAGLMCGAVLQNA